MNRSEPLIDGEIYHIYNRGNRMQPLFGDQSDYGAFLQKLAERGTTAGVRAIAYCLMPNHFHFMLQQERGGSIPSLMAALATSAAKRFNTRYGTVGHLFQGSYQYKHLSSDDFLLAASRYIHLNPVKAGLVGKPEEWPYSNFRELLSVGKSGPVRCDMSPVLTIHRLGVEGYIRLVRSAQEIRADLEAYIGGFD